MGDVERVHVSTGAGGSGGGRSEDIGALGGASLTITVSWRTALPVRQAVAKMKYPGDAISSPDAREIIEEEQKYYGILVSGLPGGAGRGGDKRSRAETKTPPSPRHSVQDLAAKT